MYNPLLFSRRASPASLPSACRTMFVPYHLWRRASRARISTKVRMPEHNGGELRRSDAGQIGVHQRRFPNPLGARDGPLTVHRPADLPLGERQPTFRTRRPPLAGLVFARGTLLRSSWMRGPVQRILPHAEEPTVACILIIDDDPE